jgi:16S rRNA (cytosine967-C5)-methyltransferase
MSPTHRPASARVRHLRPQGASAPALPALATDALAFTLLRAAEAVAAVIGGRNLDAALAAVWQQHAPLPAPRGAIQDLAYGTLRQFGRGDFLLNRLLREPFSETGSGDKPLTRALLLVALYRLETRPDEAHTIVDQAVHAAAHIGRGQFKGLVNGVLRNRLRQAPVLLAAADADEVAHLQHPAWWIARVCATYPQTGPAILAVGNSHPPMTLRVNQRRGTVTDYLARLTAAGIEARALDDTALLLARPLPVERLPGFAQGDVSVQDWGAQQAARLLDAQPGQRVLDACAAPGGKTAHILERQDVELLALELDPRRATRISDNLARLQLTATVRTADCREVDAWWDGQPFERILADVPCSASGVARRHPDIKWLRRDQDLVGFARSQREILDALWRVLAPGGKMLYCTCSLFPQENAAQIDAFLHRHADALRLPLTGITDHLNTARHGQLLPQAEHDGFFYALLQKRP